jgi:hypothetical protein
MTTFFTTPHRPCTLAFEASNQWLRATCAAYVDPYEVMREAEDYLTDAKPFPCAYLLNDNSQLRGAWFDSMEWLERAWLPRAQELGLRYIAHVLPPVLKMDVLTLRFPARLMGTLELQVFQQVEEAEEWLRSCQQRDGC